MILWLILNFESEPGWDVSLRQRSYQNMKKQQSDVVLFTASTNGLEGHPLYADYNASKAGVILLAKTLALEFASWLRVNAVCPGYVLTPMQKAEYTPEMLETVNSEIPLNRHAKLLDYLHFYHLKKLCT